MSISRKEAIIQNAIRLFNENGFYNVSMKEIAKAMDISPGNLTYHFPKKSDLLQKIQEGLIEDLRISIVPKGEITLMHFEMLFRNYYRNQRKYSFYFNNLLFIFKAFPEIAGRYRQITKQRIVEGRKLIDYYIQMGFCKPEGEGINYDSVVKSFWMISVFWTGHDAVLGNKNDDSQTSQVDVLWDLFIPYLTPKGLEEYNEIKTVRKHIF